VIDEPPAAETDDDAVDVADDEAAPAEDASDEDAAGEAEGSEK